MQRWMIGLAIFVAAIALMAIWFWRFSVPSDILEVRTRILPIGWQRCFVTDLEGDGNDEIVVETQVKGWSNLFGKQTSTVTAITMRGGKFMTFPVPLTERVMTSMPKGRRLIGESEKGDIAVAERLPNGKWKVQVLLPKAKQGIGFPDYNVGDLVGDLDGSGQDDDIVVSIGAKGERILWFQRLPDGRWVKAKEIVLPTSKGQRYHVASVTPYGMLVSVWTGTRSSLLPLLFQDGRWEFGQLDEQVHLFEGDLDGDGRNEKVLVRFLMGADKVRWRFRSRQFSRRYFEGAWDFKGWKVLNAAATEKFGDGQWHLLLVMAKDKPMTIRVLDCRFEPSKGWQVTELSRWKIVKVIPWRQLQIPDQADLRIGDTDGDGRAEIVVTSSQGNWLLRRTKRNWIVQSLQFNKGQTLLEHRPLKQVGNRLWFSRTFFEWDKTPSGISGEHLALAELGVFDSKGRWKPTGKYQPPYFIFPFRKGQEWLEDLDSNRHPEVLTFIRRLIWVHPTLYYRSHEGQWCKADLTGGSLVRELDALLRGAGVGVYPSARFFVRWEGKNWFVIVWSDGFIQAITLKSK